MHWHCATCLVCVLSLHTSTGCHSGGYAHLRPAAPTIPPQGTSTGFDMAMRYQYAIVCTPAMVTTRPTALQVDGAQAHWLGLLFRSHCHLFGWRPRDRPPQCGALLLLRMCNHAFGVIKPCLWFHQAMPLVSSTHALSPNNLYVCPGVQQRHDRRGPVSRPPSLEHLVANTNVRTLCCVVCHICAFPQQVHHDWCVGDFRNERHVRVLLRRGTKQRSPLCGMWQALTTVTSTPPNRLLTA